MTAKKIRDRQRSIQILILVGFLSGVANVSLAEFTTMVIPNEYAHAEAFGSAGWPARVRAQYIYSAELFAALPDGGAYLTSFRWRPDGETFFAADWLLDELTISAAATAQTPSNMSLLYSDNITGPVTVVRATAPWQGGTQNLGEYGGPKAFDVEFVLDAPYRYDPADGNLLLDMVARGPDLVPVRIDRLTDDDTSRAAIVVAWDDWFNSPNDPAWAYVGAMVTEMTFTWLPGDFSGDGIVDAADYVVWRENLGTTYTELDYDMWRSHFGQTAASGVSIIETVAVPEPTFIVMLVMGMSAACRRPRRTSATSNTLARDAAE